MTREELHRQATALEKSIDRAILLAAEANQPQITEELMGWQFFCEDLKRLAELAR